MDSEYFDLVFSGELVRGANPRQAKANLGKLFKISEAKVEALFSGGPVVLKKNLDFTTANKYRVAIKKAGCRVDLVEKAQEVPASPPTKPEEKPGATSSETLQTTDAKPENQASEISAETHSPPLNSKVNSESAGESPLPLPEVHEAGADGTLQLAPVGAPVLAQEERSRTVSVDIDTSALSLGEPGADLLEESEKSERVLDLQIDFDAELAPVGTDLLDESEKETVEPIQIDVSNVSLSEPGEDLGQIKESVTIQVPDVSHLSVEPG